MNESSVHMQGTFHRYWPNGTYCSNGREHVSWVTITTTAPASQIEAVGTKGPIAWCDCGGGAWVAAVPTPPEQQTGGAS